MPDPFEITLDARPRPGRSLFSRLRPVGRRLLRLPLLRALRPLAARARAVAEPAGRLLLRTDLPSGEREVQGCQEITILSANLWHDWPWYRRLPERLEAFSQLVEAESADVVLLQEVSRTDRLRADEWLAERLNMSYVYSRANGHERAIGFEEGLAVFSRHPLTAPSIQQLGDPVSTFVRRLALGVSVQTPCGDLLAFSVHLGFGRRQNVSQLAHLREWIGASAGGRPALIGGDFNAPETTPHITAARTTWLDTFRQVNPDADGATHELRWPWGGLARRSRLDYLFLQPGNRRWDVLAARHLDSPSGPHSDHRAVLARLAPVHA